MVREAQKFEKADLKIEIIEKKQGKILQASEGFVCPSIIHQKVFLLQNNAYCHSKLHKTVFRKLRDKFLVKFSAFPTFIQSNDLAIFERVNL